VATIEYKGQQLQPYDNETVLDALLREGFDTPHAKDGTPPAKSQKGLKSTQKAQGYFLSCQCVPDDDLAIGDAGIEAKAMLKHKEYLNERVMRLILELQDDFPYRAGQYLHLVRPDGLSRPYSLASLPHSSNELEVHILRVPQGQMSGWVFEEAEIGETVRVRGPVGHCFYVEEDPKQPILLAGTGTGLAPLYGILQDALLAGHVGPIYLVHGSLTRDGLYLVDELRSFAEQYDNVIYTPCVLGGESEEGITIGNIQDVVLNLTDNFAGWRVYLCGNPDLVQSMRKKIFLKGAASQDIYADAFFPVAAGAGVGG